jgi:SAM-dependent methyltransferase
VEVELDIGEFGHVATVSGPTPTYHGAVPIDHEGRTIDFGRRADDYDEHRPGFPPPFFDEVATRGWIPTAGAALDLGTGTGSLALEWARRGLTVTALDVAPELLDVVARRAASEGLEVRALHAAAEDTGLADASIDLVTAGPCWWWFDAAKAAEECWRILRPGGRLLICNFSYLALPGSAAERTEQLVLSHNPGWPKAGWRGVHPEQVEALDVAGFADVASFSFTVDVPFSHLGWRGRMRTCNGVGSALDADAVERFDIELTQLLAAEFPDPFLVRHRVFAVSGVLPPDPDRRQE